MRLVVFTDLDGTLLDHETYSYSPAEPALALLKREGVPLVLASSKTAAEIAPLHATLNLGSAPAIVENGAGVFEPGDEMMPPDHAYRRIRSTLAELPPDPARNFRGFGDMGPEEVAAATGLSRRDAALACKRCFSEPGLWTGTEADLRRFLDLLDDRGIVARRGGRFLTLSFGRTKADAMREVAERLGATVTIALGDAPNDAEMLLAADYGIVVRNDHAPEMPPLTAKVAGRIRHTEQPGPEGWNAAIVDLLFELGKT